MSDQQVCNLLKRCTQCGEVPAVTQVFDKSALDQERDFDVYGEDGNVEFVCSAAMRTAIRGNDTGEALESYVVRGFCSMHCLLSAAASEKRGEL